LVKRGLGWGVDAPAVPFFVIRKGGLSVKKTVKLNREFVYAYKKGKKIVSDCFVFYYYKNRKQTCHLGITVSKAVGKAHDRNRAKRLIRSSYRECMPPLSNGYNIIISARSKMAYVPYARVLSSMKYCIEKSELE